jgi:hypothetical protein
MTKQEFERANTRIPYGKAMQYSLTKMAELGHAQDERLHDTSHDMSIVSEDGSVAKFGTFKHADYAGYAEDLINAYRNGDLVWKEDSQKVVADCNILVEAIKTMPQVSPITRLTAIPIGDHLAYHQQVELHFETALNKVSGSGGC